jgi:DNA-binding response OmpR family regulator
MSTTILAVDDDRALLTALQMTLEAAGYGVIPCANGREALHALETRSVALIVADIAMPQMNGYQLFSAVAENAQWVDIPFIFLSARNMDSDVQFGKELGADDYLLKPVKTAELLATIKGKLKQARRRAAERQPAATAAAAADDDLLQFGPLKLAPRQYRVWVDDAPVPLSAREFKLLAALARQPGDIITHPELVHETHGLATDAQDASRLLRPLIRSLRRKLGYEAGDMGCIESVRGEGYLFVTPAPSAVEATY